MATIPILPLSLWELRLMRVALERQVTHYAAEEAEANAHGYAAVTLYARERGREYAEAARKVREHYDARVDEITPAAER